MLAGVILLMAFAQAMTDDRSTTGQLYACSVQSANRLEKSGAQPQDVAIAVIAACDGQISAAARELGGADRQYRSMITSMIKERVVAQVVEIRAARATN